MPESAPPLNPEVGGAWSQHSLKEAYWRGQHGKLQCEAWFQCSCSCLVKHMLNYPDRSQSWCCFNHSVLFTLIPGSSLEASESQFSSALFHSGLIWKMSFCRDVQTCHILSSPSQRPVDHWVIQAGRHLKRFLVQTSVQSRDRHEIRWGS